MANPTSRVFGDYVAVAAGVVATDSGAASEVGKLTDSEARQTPPQGAAYSLKMLLASPYRQPRTAAVVNAVRGQLRECLRFLRTEFPSQRSETPARG